MWLVWPVAAAVTVVQVQSLFKAVHVALPLARTDTPTTMKTDEDMQSENRKQERAPLQAT